ncbi:hypothetical protein P154DRAFT_438020 [Amniculicola lignicola CBS 123094]|uniref:Alpha-ketoglutarate-dependent dioxygenase AlkB-like domain-containing protein n=1 Tax=Amniculicola lignicola CBS 123094 TaxID=1392246 RepID=A0A6A5WE28_9PLEO|nr:hypothetical protein P154DRAFT_438020 [Amniculicola lignicola CBS 123094]
MEETAERSNHLWPGTQEVPHPPPLAENSELSVALPAVPQEPYSELQTPEVVQETVQHSHHHRLEARDVSNALPSVEASGSSIVLSALPPESHSETEAPKAVQETVQVSYHQWLKTLSKNLTAPHPIPRPAPSSRPEVWAEGRMEMCETLPYFRAYQGACYSNGGYVKGFMFDKCAHPRDYTDANVIISRAAGGMVKDKNGDMVAGSDQTINSKQCEHLRNNMMYKNPVVVIAGSDNPALPSQPPHTYCVLDYFKPTHIWSEKWGKKDIVRFRFEKLDVTKPSWWAAEGTEENMELQSLPPPHVQDCAACGNKFDMIYLNGWMCLNPSCNAYWKLADGIEPIQESLLYDPRWLKQHTPWPLDTQTLPLRPNLLRLSGYSIPGEDCSLAYWRGIVCPLCGRCSSRLSWTAWECGNPNCTYIYAPPHILIPAIALRDPYNPLSTSYALSRDIHQVPVSVVVSFAHNYRINTYTIPGIEGFIVHMIANKIIVEEPNGPDAMFEELQTTDIGLRRRPMGTALKGESHTRHFTVNYGMPYKFIAATASKSFEGAARCITDTRSRLNWAARTILGRQEWERSSNNPNEFNEVLALGYFEEQKINYHDDGEFGLGPTIATLSLGAPGTMKLRMKAKHYNGVSNSGIYVSEPPIPGCKMYAERLSAASNLQTLKDTDRLAYRARLKSLPKDIGLKRAGNGKDCITMTLAHGDVVIMHGAGIQKYYEHSVEHGGKLRFALTCRYIDPVSLKGGDRPKYEVGGDEGGYDGSALG